MSFAEDNDDRPQPQATGERGAQEKHLDSVTDYHEDEDSKIDHKKAAAVRTRSARELACRTLRCRALPPRCSQ